MGDCKSPGFIGRTFLTTDYKSVGTPGGNGNAGFWDVFGLSFGAKMQIL